MIEDDVNNIFFVEVFCLVKECFLFVVMVFGMKVVVVFVGIFLVGEGLGGFFNIFFGIVFRVNGKEFE